MRLSGPRLKAGSYDGQASPLSEQLPSWPLPPLSPAVGAFPVAPGSQPSHAQGQPALLSAATGVSLISAIALAARASPGGSTGTRPSTALTSLPTGVHFSRLSSSSTHATDTPHTHMAGNRTLSAQAGEAGAGAAELGAPGPPPDRARLSASGGAGSPLPGSHAHGGPGQAARSPRIGLLGLTHSGHVPSPLRCPGNTCSLSVKARQRLATALAGCRGNVMALSAEREEALGSMLEGQLL